ncbi:hypothetical protein EBR96_05775, partial [bacterium]|nr:hypothetical protein [bacterium]
MRLLLDTNVFLSSKFDELAKIVKSSSKFQVLGNSVALDELTHLPPESDLNKFLYFGPLANFLNVVNGRWFKNIVHLTDLELRGGKHKYWFESCVDQKRYERNLYSYGHSTDISHLQFTKEWAQIRVAYKSMFHTLQKEFFKNTYTNSAGEEFNLRDVLKKKKILTF